MSVKTYKFCTGIIGVAVAALIAWAILAEMPVYVPVLGFVVGLLILRVCRQYTREIMEDERIQKINEKASSASYRTSTIVMVIVAIVFAATKQTLPYEFEIAGITLSFTACGIMLLHLASHYYYRSRI